jgi:HEAT repeat protein
MQQLLLSHLSSANLAERLQAENDLADEGAPVVETLIGILENRSAPPEARWRAAMILGDVGDARAVEPLIRQMDDPEWAVRHSATWALGMIRDPRAFAPLRDLLLGGSLDEQVPYVAGMGLCCIDSTAAECVLRAAVTEENEAARRVALSALAVMREKK